MSKSASKVLFNQGKLQLSKSQRANDRADFELKLRKPESEDAILAKFGINSGSSKKNIQFDREQQGSSAIHFGIEVRTRRRL